MSENINKMALLEILAADDDPGSLQLLEKRTREVRELSKALTVAEPGNPLVFSVSKSGLN